MSVRMITKINRLTVVIDIHCNSKKKIDECHPVRQRSFEFLRMSVFTLSNVNLDSNYNVGNGGGQLGMALLSI